MSQESRWSRRRAVQQTVGSSQQKTIQFEMTQSNRTSGEDEGERKASVHAAPCAQTHPVSPRSMGYARPEDVPESAYPWCYSMEPLAKHQYDYGRGNAIPPTEAQQSNRKYAEEYVEFNWKTNDLLSELPRLKFSLGRVGGCGPVIQAIDALNRPFQDLQWLFGFNTYSLSPQPSDPRFKQLRPRDDGFLSRFPCTFEAISVGLELMEKAIGDLHGAYHENSTMYLLACLKKRFKESILTVYVIFKSEASRISIARGSYAATETEELKHEIQLLLGSFLIRAVESLGKELNIYCEKGIQDIFSLQKSRSTRYSNLTMVATFLSVVTVSLLQISVDDTEGPLAIGVNTFLFSSLIFSIASVIYSLLVAVWLGCMTCGPTAYMPFWLSTCIYKVPMVLLAISLVFFVTALCLLVFSSSQHIVTSTVTVSFAGLIALSFLLFVIWLILERWRFQNVADSAGDTLPVGNPFPWPSVNLMNAGSPSRLERGTCGLASEESPSPKRDGAGCSFRPDNEAGLGGSGVGRANDEQYDLSCPSESSVAVGPERNVENDCSRSPERESEDRRIPLPVTLVPDALGYVPNTHNGYSKYNDRAYDTVGPRYRCCCSSVSHIKDNARDYDRGGAPDPFYNRSPLVGSHTYDLPHDNQDEPEKLDGPTTVSQLLPSVLTPTWPKTPSSPSPLVPTPTVASCCGRGMVLPSAQAVNRTIQPVIPEPPQESSISPRLRCRSKDKSAAYAPEHGDSRTHIPCGLDDGTWATNCDRQLSEGGIKRHQDRTCPCDVSALEKPRGQSLGQESGSSSGKGQSTADNYNAHTLCTTMWSDLPRTSFRQKTRCCTSSSNKVRFAPSVVNGPEGQRSTAEKSVLAGEQSTTSVLSQTLMHPQELEPAEMEVYAAHGRTYLSVGSQTNAAVEVLGVQNRGESEASPTQRDTIDIDASSLHDLSSGHREHVSEYLSTNEETNRPSAADDSDSSDSEGSAVTALESQWRQRSVTPTQSCVVHRDTGRF